MLQLLFCCLPFAKQIVIITKKILFVVLLSDCDAFDYMFRLVALPSNANTLLAVLFISNTRSGDMVDSR